MPFVSDQQRAWMWINHPEMAAEWEAEEDGVKPVKALPMLRESPKREGMDDECD